MAFPGRIQLRLDNNKVFSNNYKTPPTMRQMRANATKTIGGTLILTCLDPRCFPEHYFGPNLGAGVIRNAGGRVTEDTIRSIVSIRSLMQGMKNVIVLHHSDCGMTFMTDDQVAEEAKQRTPDAASEIDHMDFGCFTTAEYEDTIKKDVVTLRNTKALAGMTIYGFSMDIETGVVKPVDI